MTENEIKISAKGYFGKPELTDEKFIKFVNNQIIYNTNDLAYYTYDGEIIHLGRADFQVKMNGYRIELGEIENTISVFDNITSCAVGCPTLNNKKVLCAYYTSSKDINTVSAFLAKNLTAFPGNALLSCNTTGMSSFFAAQTTGPHM